MSLVSGLKHYSGFNSINDLVHGHPGDALRDEPYIGSAASNLLNRAFNPAPVDTSSLVAATGVAGANQAKYGGQQGTLFNENQGLIGTLNGAASGAVPSAAEIQLRDQANRNAAQNFGAAAAIGGRSPGEALYQATQGGQAIQAKTNSDAAALRANEMATARGQLVSAIGQPLGTTTGADVTSTGQGITGANDQADINAKNAAAKQAGAAGLVKTLMSPFGI